jgi:hypothetical protein
MTMGTNNPYLEELQFHLAKMGAGSMPRTAGAMSAGANLIRNTWKGFAMGGPLPGITEPLKRPSGGYARSIHIVKIGPFQYEIASEAQIAEWIENGTDELDMKKTHPFGPRSRVSKKGVPYLIVPFRWGTPKTIGFKNIIPDSIYKQLLTSKKHKFLSSQVTRSADKSGRETPNAHRILNGRSNVKGTSHSEMVGRAGYSWGDRVFADDIFMLTAGGKEDYYAEGMVKMEGQNRRSSGYFTFRIISAKSPKNSWIKPAMAARPVTRAVADNTSAAISTMVESAIMEDLGL